MKTRGQRLYEHKHPKFLTVCEYEDVFRTKPFIVENPNHFPSWELLTKACKDRYEQQAKNHYLFSEASS